MQCRRLGLEQHRWRPAGLPVSCCSERLWLARERGSALPQPLGHQRAPFTALGPASTGLCCVSCQEHNGELRRDGVHFPAPSAELMALVDVQPAEQEQGASFLGTPSVSLHLHLSWSPWYPQPPESWWEFGSSG